MSAVVGVEGKPLKVHWNRNTEAPQPLAPTVGLVGDQLASGSNSSSSSSSSSNNIDNNNNHYHNKYIHNPSNNSSNTNISDKNDNNGDQNIEARAVVGTDPPQATPVDAEKGGDSSGDDDDGDEDEEAGRRQRLLWEVGEGTGAGRVFRDEGGPSEERSGRYRRRRAPQNLSLIHI